MAFPTTPILDTFTGADISPLTGWWSDSPVYYLVNLARRVSNRCEVLVGGVDSHPAWSVSYNPNQEAYATIASWGSGDTLYICCRGTNWNSSNYTNNFYNVRVTQSSNLFAIESTLSDNTTTIASTTQAISVGDSIGIAAIGNTIQGWYKPAAGSWTMLLQQTDTDVPWGGQIGMLMVNNVAVDNFGGGNIPTTAGTTDITGKGRAPFRSSWAMLQDGGGIKSGTSFLSPKSVFYGDKDTTDSTILTNFFFPSTPAPPPRRIFNIS